MKAMNGQGGGRDGQSSAPDKRPPLMRGARIPLTDQPAGCSREPLLSEEVLQVDPRFIGRVFSVEVQDVKLPDGRETTRELVRHPGGACVVALDEQGYLTLVHQYRVGTGGPLRELPAGKLEPPEKALTCARRELAEETGYTASHWELLTRFQPSPGYTDEVIYIYLARGLTLGQAHPDEGEFIACERISLGQALLDIDEGRLTDGKTCLGILLAARRLGLTG
ncbi:MAG: NUDIX hydrolase [Clostridiaceae bacterium]|nr:NUDIX hydrolase [Clostridiaceae bacterium]